MYLVILLVSQDGRAGLLIPGTGLNAYSCA